MPRPRIYANDAEKMRAHRAMKNGHPFKVVDGYVTVDRGLKVTPKVTSNKVTVTNQKRAVRFGQRPPKGGYKMTEGEKIVQERHEQLLRVKKTAHKELIVTIMRTKVNRGISNERLYSLAEFVVDTIYKDCRGY